MADAGRARRLSGRIKQIVATHLEMQVKDPRLGMLTITDVRVTPDLHEATIFYTVLGDETARADTAAALESAKGVLRTEVGRQTGVRFTPSLTFIADSLAEDAAYIADLLAVAARADAQLAAVREGAQPAGEADPYRKPRVISDEDDEDDESDDDATEDDEADGDADDAAPDGEPDE